MERPQERAIAIARQVQERLGDLGHRLMKLSQKLGDQQFWRKVARVRHWRFFLPALFIFLTISPLLTAGGVALAQYAQLRSWGLDGVAQLTAIKDLLPISSNTTTTTASKTPVATTTPGSSGIQDKAKNILNKETLTKIKQHCDAAKADFQKINATISGRQGVVGLAMGTSYGPKILATQQLAIIGIDISTLGSQLADVGMQFTDTFKTSPFSPDGDPLLTASSFASVQQALVDTQTILTDVQAHLQQTNLNDLPVSKEQRDQINKYLPYLPKALKDIQTFMPYLPVAGWALGVDSSRTYLIQTMDRSELRPSGGFNGSWGLLNINGGRIGKIDLTDVTFVDYSSDNKVFGQSAPAPYNKWWTFGNWGLRDANLSGDYPHSAQLSMDTFTREIGTPVDGDISFSPQVIEHLLKPEVLGPITIPCYNVTITSENLEDTLHFYQLSDEGKKQQDVCSSGNTSTSLRKRFTAALAAALQDRLRGASQDVLLQVLGSVKDDLATKELQVYVKNDDIEALLNKDHLDASINHDPGVDSTYMVQANVSISKGSQFVDTKMSEYIGLDANGGAYHDLVVSLDYHPTGNVYGFLTYRDYVRVYVPQNAQFIDGSGFQQYHYIEDPNHPNAKLGSYPQPLCYLTDTPTTTPLPPPLPNPDPTLPPIPYAYASQPCQPAQAPICKGIANPAGPTGQWLKNMEGSSSYEIFDIGQPTARISDEPGHSMFGGLIVIPPFCTATFELQWYVPGIAGKGDAQNLPYTFVAERQAGTVNNLTVDIVPAQGIKVAPVHQVVNVDRDQWFSLGAK